MDNRIIVAHGLQAGLDSIPGLLFRTDCPYRYCRICGEVYQTERDRNTPQDLLKRSTWQADVNRRQQTWSINHGKLHSDRQHTMLRMSGLWLTPEAAQKLAAFGIVPVSDMVLSEESASALANAPNVPTNDSEG